MKKMELYQTNRLSSIYINSLPIIRFKGTVIVVNEKKQANRIIQKLNREAIIGMDTESRPSFSKGISYPPSIIQFATHHTAYLFRLKTIQFPDSLADLLENKNIAKIGIGLKDDIQKLQSLRKFQMKNCIDLSKIAEKKGIIQVGARALTARYLEHRLTKTAQTSNWALPHLTEKQKIYAATDAWICLQIYPLLIADQLNYHQMDASIPNP
ncbi:MAG: 3'-5' exonuclease domain-containing protein 2 [Candidatus Aminicenantes bacterium]|nr:3'-5' exonuclease domain-containing protein 2 [Candidatus Aminicenantes bacterium]